MTCTVVLQVTDHLGHAAWYQSDANGGRYLSQVQAHPASSFIDQQPGRIPITVNHNGPQVGFVDYLEHGIDQHTDLRAVGTVEDLDADLVDGIYCSADILGEYRRGALEAEKCTLTGIAFVDETAGVCPCPVKAFDGDYRVRSEREAILRARNAPRIVERAAKAVGTEYRWSRPKSLRIVRPTGFEQRAAAGLDPLEHRSPIGEPISVREYGPHIPGVGRVEYSTPYAGILSVR